VALASAPVVPLPWIGGSSLTPELQPASTAANAATIKYRFIIFLLLN